MIGLDHHAHAVRLQGLLQRVRDLVGQALLHLEPPGEHLHDPRDLAQSEQSSLGNIGDVRLSEERQHVVLAERIQLDVLDEDHVVVLLDEHARSDRLTRVGPVSAREPFHRLGDPAGCVHEARSRRVLAQPPQLLPHQVLIGNGS